MQGLGKRFLLVGGGEAQGCGRGWTTQGFGDWWVLRMGYKCKSFSMCACCCALVWVLVCWDSLRVVQGIQYVRVSSLGH